MRVYLSLSAPLLVSLLFVGCSSSPKPQQAKDTPASRITDLDEKVLKEDPLERNYDPHVIMKRAESFFEKENYAEAAVEYQHFLDLHKTHILASYAQYRLGLSHYKQVTTKDRDPGPVRQTMDAMEKLMREYPGSSYENDARSKIKECREHMAAYELYVGLHYYRLAAYLAAMHRFEGVLAQFPDTEAAAEAQYHLALTHKDLGDTGQAVEHLASLLKSFPKAKVRKESQSLLAKLTGKPLNGVVAATSPIPSSLTSLPSPLPPLSLTRSLSMNPADLPLPNGNGYGHGPSVVTCNMNVMC